MAGGAVPPSALGDTSAIVSRWVRRCSRAASSPTSRRSRRLRAPRGLRRSARRHGRALEAEPRWCAPSTRRCAPGRLHRDPRGRPLLRHGRLGRAERQADGSVGDSVPADVEEERHTVGIAPEPLLAGSNERISVLARGSGPWRGGSVSCRSTRRGRTAGTSAGAPTAAHLQALVAAVVAGHPARVSRWLHTAIGQLSGLRSTGWPEATRGFFGRARRARPAARPPASTTLATTGPCSTPR